MKRGADTRCAHLARRTRAIAVMVRARRQQVRPAWGLPAARRLAPERVQQMWAPELQAMAVREWAIAKCFPPAP